uniref:Pleckstrin homology domain containing A6 n=1 Tax=Oncorhynchus kisutch TaxID=8019 RepID=A0A8C7N6D9_ONCKI
MNGNVGGRGPVSSPSDINCNSNSTTMVSDLSSPESQTQSQPFTPRASRTPKKAATFGKRSNSMRRNPKAVVAKQGWLYKQASSGVKQWNKRWFVLTDRCLFYYKDEKEEGVLGSLPLLSFRIGEVQVLDNISRKHAFKVWYEEEEEGEIKGTIVFCLQAEHAGTRTYYFGAETAEEQEEWIDAMNEAAHVQIPPAQRTTNSEATTPTAELHGNTLVTKGPEPHTQTHTHIEDNGQTTELLDPERGSREPAHHKVNGVDAMETPPPSTSHSEKDGRMGGERGERGERGVLGPGGAPHHQPNGWGTYGPPNHGNGPPQGNGRPPQAPPEGRMREGREVREQPENVVLRRGFVPRTNPERQAQRKSSMTQLQQWVNQRRVIAVQEDLNSPSHYYTVNRGVPADYYSVYSSVGGGPGYVEEYPLYPPGVRPDSICSVSAVGYDRMGPPRWTNDEKRRSLRDGPLYRPPPPRDPYGPPPSPAYYGQMDAAQTAMRRLSIQPRSRSVPRSPSSSTGGPYSPSPHSFASPICSPSARFDRGPGRLREDVIYADPSVYGLRRSLSSPKYDYPGDRRSLSQGMYHYNYPASPSLHSKMVPPFHDPYRELHPTLKLNEIETSKLLGRLCEQNRFLKDQEAVVHRLRMDKDSLEGALVATHQEMELYRGQPLVADKLQLKKETLQNQLINIRGELSQASSALTTTRMEFEALEDEVNAIHGDLWEQLNAGGQSEMVHRHIQKEFWRVQEVWEGLHKSNLSRGTDTAKHRVASGASGSFSTNSPASPLSSVSLTSPLSPFSPVPGSQASPTKQLGPEVSTSPSYHPRNQPNTNLGLHLCPQPNTHLSPQPNTQPEQSVQLGPESNTQLGADPNRPVSEPKTHPGPQPNIHLGPDPNTKYPHIHSLPHTQSRSLSPETQYQILYLATQSCPKLKSILNTQTSSEPNRHPGLEPNVHPGPEPSSQPCTCQANQLAPVESIDTQQHAQPYTSQASQHDLRDTKDTQPNTRPNPNPTHSTSQVNQPANMDSTHLEPYSHRASSGVPLLQGDSHSFTHSPTHPDKLTNQQAPTGSNPSHQHTQLANELSPQPKQQAIGYRKDVLPDPPSYRASYPAFLRYPPQHTHLTVPETKYSSSRQNPCLVSQLACSHTPDPHKHSLPPHPRTRVLSTETQYRVLCLATQSREQSQGRSRSRTRTRPLTFPNNQLDVIDGAYPTPHTPIPPHTHPNNRP